MVQVSVKAGIATLAKRESRPQILERRRKYNSRNGFDLSRRAIDDRESREHCRSQVQLPHRQFPVAMSSSPMGSRRATYAACR